MQVFKFGGASVSNVDRIRNVAGILHQYPDQKLLVVISAMGKTTNALEKVVEAFFSGDQERALQLFAQVRDQHITLAKYLLVTHYNECISQLNNFFTEVEWLLHDKPVKNFDYYYDQVVCIGELLSTSIVSAFLNEAGVKNSWTDVRDIIRTDDNFRDANIDWAFTEKNVQTNLLPLFEQSDIVITQGFIGATDENESTTLGREGSDYTAAVFANILNAANQTIWKDVEGVMNADPKIFPEAQYISELNYREVIEMAYYGAQVIHPKTIKPLQNKGIPLHVKCFLDPSSPGTVIHSRTVTGLPPIIVLKEDQALLNLRSQDFSFVGEKPMSDLYRMLADVRIKPNLVQTGAVSIMLCLDDKPERIQQLALAASENFEVTVEKGLTLLTIRHWQEEVLARLTSGKKVLLRQETEETVQVLMH